MSARWGHMNQDILTRTLDAVLSLRRRTLLASGHGISGALSIYASVVLLRALRCQWKLHDMRRTMLSVLQDVQFNGNTVVDGTYVAWHYRGVSGTRVISNNLAIVQTRPEHTRWISWR